MPAVKYHTKNSIGLANDFHKPEPRYVDILRFNGGSQPVIWMGFYGPEAVGFKVDHCHQFVKMKAISVSKDVGGAGSDWRVLRPGEYVICWLEPYNFSYPCVRTICDAQGWPMVRGHRKNIVAA